MRAPPHPAPLADPASLDSLRQQLKTTSLVIFDFDGVIADSEVLSLATLRDTLATYGMDLPLDEVRERFLGASLRTITTAAVSQLGTAFAAEAFAEAWESALFAAFRSDLAPVAGIGGVLDALTARALPYCVASSSTHERLAIALEAIGMADRFPHVFSAQEVLRGKPAPDLFLHACAQMQTAPDACLVVEDSPLGVAGASAAGIGCVGFLGGSHLTDLQTAHGARLHSAGAQWRVHGHDTLADLLHPS